MILVFIFLGFVILIFLQFVLLLLSTIKIEIKNINIENKEKQIIKYKYKIKISINLFEKVPILWINLDNKKVERIKNNFKIKKIDFSKVTSRLKENKIEKRKIIKALKEMNVKLEEIKIKANFGTEDVILTSFIVTLISCAVGILLPKIAGKNIDKCNYRIMPIYQNKNEYQITLNGIFYIKIVHIICSILSLIKKGSNEKNERTSNRRSYAYRYE